MSISGIPNSFTQPGVYVNLTINDSTAGNDTFNILVLGNAATGSAYAKNPALYPVTSLTQLATDFGTSSDVYNIIKTFKAIDSATSVYALNCIAGEVTTTVSNGTVTTINSVLSTTAQSADMSGTGVSASGGSGTGATFDITSTANSGDNTFTPASVTINNGGSGYAIGDKLTIANVGTLTVTALDSKTATSPEGDLTTLSNALVNVGNVEFDIITGGFNSALAIQAIDTYLLGTWSYDKELYGHYITYNQKNSLTDLVSTSDNFNSKNCSVLEIPTELDANISLGSFVAQVSTRTQTNSSLPLRGFALNSGLISIPNRFDAPTRSTLFSNGYCTVVADTVGNPTVERTRIGATTDNGIQINDTSLETRFQAVQVAKRFRTGLSPLVSSPKIIMDDADVVQPSTYIVTPSSIYGTCVSIYTGLINELVCKDMKSFKKNLSVTIDPAVPGRVNIVMQATLASGLNQITINLSVEK